MFADEITDCVVPFFSEQYGIFCLNMLWLQTDRQLALLNSSTEADILLWLVATTYLDVTGVIINSL